MKTVLTLNTSKGPFPFHSLREAAEILEEYQPGFADVGDVELVCFGVDWTYDTTAAAFKTALDEEFARVFGSVCTDYKGARWANGWTVALSIDDVKGLPVLARFEDGFGLERTGAAIVYAELVKHALKEG